MARAAALPDEAGYFGRYGGRFIPETLMAPVAELARAYDKASKDRAFKKRFADLSTHYCGRPTPLYLAERLSKELGGAWIYLKREDLLHTGAHKLNNALGQAVLARRLDELTHASAVRQDLRTAKRLKLRSTPVFFINGRMLLGAPLFLEPPGTALGGAPAEIEHLLAAGHRPLQELPIQPHVRVGRIVAAERTGAAADRRAACGARPGVRARTGGHPVLADASRPHRAHCSAGCLGAQGGIRTKGVPRCGRRHLVGLLLPRRRG